MNKTEKTIEEEIIRYPDGPFKIHKTNQNRQFAEISNGTFYLIKDRKQMILENELDRERRLALENNLVQITNIESSYQDNKTINDIYKKLEKVERKYDERMRKIEESIKIIHLNTKQILDKVYRVENNFNEEIQNLKIEYNNRFDKIEEQLICNLKKILKYQKSTNQITK